MSCLVYSLSIASLNKFFMIHRVGVCVGCSNTDPDLLFEFIYGGLSLFHLLLQLLFLSSQRLQLRVFLLHLLLQFHVLLLL